MEKYNFIKNTSLKKLLGALFFLCTSFNYTSAQTLHSTGLIALPPVEYAALPRPNWAIISTYSSVVPSTEVLYGRPGVVMLNNPPIGEQLTLNSCVGWSVGYTAMGILTYSKYRCWTNARRSPSYVYNQIKQVNTVGSGGACGGGSQIKDGLNLIKAQGVCSWNLMPYNTNNCQGTGFTSLTVPDAAQNKATDWAAFDNNDLEGIKKAIDYGFPVVVGLNLNQSFDDMWNSDGIWSNNSGSTTGLHSTTVVGYDNNRQQLKIQNQWGAGSGDGGYFWVTYDMVKNQNCFIEAYVVYGTSPSYPLKINGPEGICAPATSAQFSVNYLQCNAGVIWQTNVPQVTVVSTSPSTCTAYSNGYAGNVTITATTTVGTPALIATKDLLIGTAPSSLSQTPYWIQNGVTNYLQGCNQIIQNCNFIISKKIVDSINPNIVNPNPKFNYCATGYITDVNATSFSWSKVAASGTHISWNGYGNTFNVEINANFQNEWITLRCTAANKCGSGYRDYKFFVNPNNNVNCPYCPGCRMALPPNQEETSTISIFPNPSTGQFNVSIKSSKKEIVIKEIRVKNKIGALVFEQKFNSNLKSQSINISSNPLDMYIVEVFDGYVWQTQKITLYK